VIIDTQRTELYYIPNDLHRLLKENPKGLINSDDPIVQDYLSFLLENELGFIIDEVHNFPPIQFIYEDAASISHAILEFEDFENYNVDLALSKIAALGCKNIFIRFKIRCNLNTVTEVFKFVFKHEFNSVDICVSHKKIEMEEVKDFVYKNPTIRNFILIEANKDDVLRISEDGMSTIVCDQSSLHERRPLGPKLFNLNIKFIDESIRFHNHLKGKISIDSKGEVKNLPSFERSFGHVDTHDLDTIVSSNEFNQYWYVQKDQIDVCKDCEHRYICPHLISKEEEVCSKPLSCSYNPYTAKWED